MEFLRSAGIRFDSAEEKWTLSTTQNQTLLKTLQLWSLTDEQGKIDFLSYITEMFKEHSSLKTLLVPLQFCSSSSVTLSINDSLLKLIAQIPGAQFAIFSKVFDAIPELEFRVSSSTIGDMPKMLLNQLRWVRFSGDPKRFTEILRKTISICTLDSTRIDIIEWIPDVASESLSEALCPVFLELLNDYPCITLAAVDSLSSMCLSAESVATMFQVILKMLPSATEDQIPILVKFLLRTVEPGDVRSLVRAMRNSLHIETLRSYYELLENCLESCLKMRRDFADAYVDELSNLTERCIMLDLWMLLTISNVYCRKRCEIEQVLKNKIILNLCDSKVIVQVIRNNGLPPCNLFDNIMDWAQFLIDDRSPYSRRLEAVATDMYIASYKSFANKSDRTSVMSNLISHLSNKISSKVDAALSAILQLVVWYVEMMQFQFCTLENLIDYLDFVPLRNHQIYAVYIILLRVACYRGGREVRCENRYEQQLSMLLDKQVGSPDQRHQNMGSLGSAAFVDAILDFTPTDPQQRITKYLKNNLSFAKFATSKKYFLEQLGTILERKEDVDPTVLDVILRETEENLNLFLRWSSDKSRTPIECSTHLWCNEIANGLVALGHYKHDAIIIDFGSSNQISCCHLLPIINSLMRLYCIASLKRKSRRVNEFMIFLIFAGFALFPPLPLKENTVALNQHLNSISPRSIESMINGLLYAINWVRDSLNFIVRLPELNQYFSSRISHLVKLETALDLVSKNVYHYPIYMPSMAPLDYSAQTNDLYSYKFERFNSINKKNNDNNNCNSKENNCNSNENNYNSNENNYNSNENNYNNNNKCSQKLLPLRPLNVETLKHLSFNIKDASSNIKIFKILLDDVEITIVNEFERRDIDSLVNRQDGVFELLPVLQLFFMHLKNLALNETQEKLRVACICKILHILYMILEEWIEQANGKLMAKKLFADIESMLLEQAPLLISITKNEQDTCLELLTILQLLGEFFDDMASQFMECTSDCARVLLNIADEEGDTKLKLLNKKLKKILEFYLNASNVNDQLSFERLENVCHSIHNWCHRRSSPDFNLCKNLNAHNLHLYYQAAANRIVKLWQMAFQDNLVWDDTIRKLVWIRECLRVYQYLLSCDTELEHFKLAKIALRGGKVIVEEFLSKCEWICSQLNEHPEQVTGIIVAYQNLARRLQIACNNIKKKKSEKLGFLVPLLKKSIETVAASMRIFSLKFGFSDAIDITLLSPSVVKDKRPKSDHSVSKSPFSKRLKEDD